MGFVNCETGAATVDWMIISAGCICMTLAVMQAMKSGASTQTDMLSQTLDGSVVFTQFGSPQVE